MKNEENVSKSLCKPPKRSECGTLKIKVGRLVGASQGEAKSRTQLEWGWGLDHIFMDLRSLN